jgi:hypothetical protein
MRLEVLINEDEPLFITTVTKDLPLFSNVSKGSIGVGHIISGIGEYHFGQSEVQRQNGRREALRGGFVTGKHLVKFAVSDLKNMQLIRKTVSQYGLNNATENWVRIKIPRGNKRFIVKHMTATGPINLGKINSSPGMISRVAHRAIPNSRLLQSAGKLSGPLTKALRVNVALESIDWLYQLVEARNNGYSLQVQDHIKALSNIGGAIGGSYVAAFTATIVAGVSTAGLPAIVVIAFPIIAGSATTLLLPRGLDYILNKARQGFQHSVHRYPTKQEVTRFLRESYGLSSEAELGPFQTAEVFKLLDKYTPRTKGCNTSHHR